ncbi:arsenate-mycothiol transferase ArsC [Corynebacterium comes]|uniref:Arsenate-mycothiol transferase ArsC1 n=1 Tax=Corynebacterium comes TaxID=2675218 RepID=A0A6B8W2S4_9CORY|nr:protein tyrosine phosphatase [Corynebacterium comes]QGU05725.1 Arsenate-mycothiol transferase ArsC1 [Corynebacterium comes]
MTGDRFAIVREDMHRRYGQHFEAEVIDDLVDRTIGEITERARIKTYLPVLVEREVSEVLEQLATRSDPNAVARPEVLYVCQRNAGRSQLAACITHHLVGDRVFVRSIGLEPESGVDPNVLAVLEERGISTEYIYKSAIVPRTVHRAEVVVLMGVHEIPAVPGHRYVYWNIGDPAGRGLGTVRRIADEVEAHVRELLRELDIEPQEAVSGVAANG